MSNVPSIRIQAVNDRPPRPAGDYVLYWMIAHRRIRRNFALEHAANLAHDRGVPLVVLEALRCDYPWASDRLHRFLIDGMADNAADCAEHGLLYHPYVEPEKGAGKGLLAALARRAAAVVTDDFPCFFLPRMVDAAGRALDVRLEKVDGNGLIPLRAPERAFPTAHSFRRWIQKHLREHLGHGPKIVATSHLDLPRLEGLPPEILRRWPAADADLLAGRRGLGHLPLDHDVAPPEGVRGGPRAGLKRLARFLEAGLSRYEEDRNQPEETVTSGLSPWLHCGHVAAWEIFDAVMEREGWRPERLGRRTDGSRSGWWNVSSPAEAFLDQLVTWREVGFNGAAHLEGYTDYDSLPDWALRTLENHAGDERPHLYDLEGFEAARTHDALWNAAQNQLRRSGELHNYLRMLWGKKILHWSADPQEALQIMVHLNNKYALDGRDPNSYSGIFWVLGRYDRAWGPERPVFGKIRYMSSGNTARKVRVRDYVARWGSGQGELL